MQHCAMARNIEIKARVHDLPALEVRVHAVATAGPQSLTQDDHFFPCPHGRLKLRAFADGSAELIAYIRPDAPGPKTSTYLRTPVTDARALRATLLAALGDGGRVRKQRTVYWVGATRVHLDRVDGLGDFMELEVVLRDDQTAAEGDAVARDLLKVLQIADADLRAGAYLDLMNHLPVTPRS